MSDLLKELTVVALLQELKLGDRTVPRGAVGAVVRADKDPRLCDVEFVINREGETLLVNSIETQLLLPLMWWE